MADKRRRLDSANDDRPSIEQLVRLAELSAPVARRYVITNDMTNAVQFFRLHRSQ